jgi:hypothetical protein
VVAPVLSPAVVKAAMHSNSASAKPTWLDAITTREPTTTALTAITAIVRAWRWTATGTPRRNAVTSGSPRNSAQTTRNRRAKVVTLMPPATEALPPPANISISVMRSESASTSP